MTTNKFMTICILTCVLIMGCTYGIGTYKSHQELVRYKENTRYWREAAMLAKNIERKTTEMKRERLGVSPQDCDDVLASVNERGINGN